MLDICFVSEQLFNYLLSTENILRSVFINTLKIKGIKTEV